MAGSAPQRAAADALIDELALAAAAGDRTALGEFIRLTHPDVRRFLAHLAGPEAADDLTQDTYVRAMDGLSGFAGRGHARSWLLTIARRTAADVVRREQARPRTVGYGDQRLAQAPVADAVGAVDLNMLLNGLGPDRRAAFLLTQVLGFTYAEAAVVCDCRIGTIRSRVARARADLIVAVADDACVRRAS